MSLHYRAAKIATIVLGSLSICVGTYAGFCFGAEHYWRGIIVVLALSALTAFDTWLYLWILEKMTGGK